MQKICNTCSKQKDATLFIGGRNKCKECNNLERRSKYKKSTCVKCGESFRPGVEGRYKFCSEMCRFMIKVNKDEKMECWMWKANKDDLGYGRFVPVGGRSALAHRVSYRLFKGPISEGMLILHSCHVPSCVAPHHLRQGTNADNMKDKIEAKRVVVPTGIEHHRAKLNETDVMEIRSSSLKQKELAKKYGVSIHAISAIIRRVSWKHI